MLANSKMCDAEFQEIPKKLDVVLRDTDYRVIVNLFHSECTRWHDIGTALGLKAYQLSIIECDYRGNANRQMNEVLHLWTRSTVRPTWRQLTAVMTPTQLRMIGMAPKSAELDKKIDTMAVVKLAKMMPSWKNIMRCLGMEEQQLSDIEHTYRDAADQRHEALARWCKMQGSGATFARLWTAANEIGEGAFRDNIEGVAALPSTTVAPPEMAPPAAGKPITVVGPYFTTALDVFGALPIDPQDLVDMFEGLRNIDEGEKEIILKAEQKTVFDMYSATYKEVYDYCSAKFKASSACDKGYWMNMVVFLTKHKNVFPATPVEDPRWKKPIKSVAKLEELASLLTITAPEQGYPLSFKLKVNEAVCARAQALNAINMTHEDKMKQIMYYTLSLWNTGQEPKNIGFLKEALKLCGINLPDEQFFDLI